MENIINIYCSGTKKSFILKIPYKEINTINGYIYVRITNKDSIFNTRFDLFCIYKDKKFIFNTIKIPLESEDITDNHNELEIQLIVYLKYYFKDKNKMIMTYKEKSKFNFKHNINIDRKANSYFAFYKKYMHNCIIRTDNYNFVYKQTNFKNTCLLNDILRLKPNMIFYATILPILPLDIILLILKSKLDENFFIFLYYRAYKLLYRKYPKVSAFLIYKIIDKLQNNLNIELVDYFQSVFYKLIDLNNWYNNFIFPDEFSIQHKLKNKTEQNYELNILSGNKIYRTDTNIFNKNDSLYINDIFVIYIYIPIFIDYLVIEVNKSEVYISIYKNISSSEKILVDLSFLNSEDIFFIRKVVTSNSMILVNYKFVYIKRDYKVSIEVYKDINNIIYKVDDNFIKLNRGESSKIISKISNNYLESFDINY